MICVSPFVLTNSNFTGHSTNKLRLKIIILLLLNSVTIALCASYVAQWFKSFFIHSLVEHGLFFPSKHISSSVDQPVCNTPYDHNQNKQKINECYFWCVWLTLIYQLSSFESFFTGSRASLFLELWMEGAQLKYVTSFTLTMQLSSGVRKKPVIGRQATINKSD